MIKLAFRVLIVVSSAFCGCSNSKNLNSGLDSECLPIVESFFSTISKNNYAEALTDLLQSNPYINTSDSTALDLVTKFKLINDRSGKFIGYQLLKKREIDNTLALYSYLAKYERKFYRFIFVFYKATDKAKIYRFSFDDAIDIEVEESLKLYVQ
jgi:hypothetical protein